MYRFHVKLTELGTKLYEENSVSLFSQLFFHQIFFRLTGIQDRLKSLDEFEIGQDQTF